MKQFNLEYKLENFKVSDDARTFKRNTSFVDGKIRQIRILHGIVGVREVGASELEREG